ncbi:MAG: L,D-transpeptidase family protein [Verrucomicrobiaceae bacterium]|nr:L,D-transpeptidase family protein [Verrucomicrobiaceae bacterium]
MTNNGKKVSPRRIAPGVYGLLTLVVWAMGPFGPIVVNAQIGPSVRQVVVATAPDWNTHRATLQCFQRPSAKAPWQAVLPESVPVLLGRNGLAWGRGVFNVPQNGVAMKVERDGRAPAGVFQLGLLFGYAGTAPKGSLWPYHQVGKWDAYVDDPQNPNYNRHVVIDPRNVPPWFEKQRMRLGDSAYKWMLEIRHNQNPVAPGYGSAIFFHVRRGPDKPSAGCTTMAVENLERILRWLDPRAFPHYVLLPRADYQALRGAWGLP